MQKSHIIRIDQIKLVNEPGNPPHITVAAQGMASTPGWSQPVLMERPCQLAEAAGVRVFDFAAIPPGDIRPQVLAPVSAAIRIAGPFPEKLRILVVARTNSMEQSSSG